MISDYQRREINELLKYLRKLPDIELDYLTECEADELIDRLSKEKTELLEKEQCKVIDFYKYYERKRLYENKKLGYVEWR